MNGNELMVLGFFGCASLIVLWLRHSKKKIKLSFWKVCLLGLGGVIFLAIYLNWPTIKSYVAYMSGIRKAKKAEETIRNSQREKLFIELEKLEDGKDPKSLERIREIRSELANLNPPPPQLEKRERIVRVFDIPAGNGRNEEGNIFFTNLSGNKGDLIKFTILSGSLMVRNGKGEGGIEGDKIIIKSSRTLKAHGLGTIQFIQSSKPTKVRVEIIPRT